MDEQATIGMVGPFWVVEANKNPTILALAVPLERADTYGDMLTLDTGHYEYWSRLAFSGGAALRAEGLPTAPVWSEYDEWPRGRVVHDTTTRQFVIRADRQLHRPEFIRLILARFCIACGTASVVADDHYRSVRRLRS